MHTRTLNNIFKPKKLIYFFPVTMQSSLLDDEPHTMKQALSAPHWHDVMSLEFNALLQNKIRELIPPHLNQNIIHSKWVFRIKRNLNGTI